MPTGHFCIFSEETGFSQCFGIIWKVGEQGAKLWSRGCPPACLEAAAGLGRSGVMSSGQALPSEAQRHTPCGGRWGWQGISPLPVPAVHCGQGQSAVPGLTPGPSHHCAPQVWRHGGPQRCASPRTGTRRAWLGSLSHQTPTVLRVEPSLNGGAQDTPAKASSVCVYAGCPLPERPPGCGLGRGPGHLKSRLPPCRIPTGPAGAGSEGQQGAPGVKRQLVWAQTSTSFLLWDLLRVTPSFPRYGSKKPPSKSTIWNAWCLCLETVGQISQSPLQASLRAERQDTWSGTKATERLPSQFIPP